MEPNVTQISAAIVIAISPFLPLLLQAGKFTAGAIAEMVVQKGGERAWTKAKALWNRIMLDLGGDEDIEDAARMLARQPENETRQTALAEILVARLHDNPGVADELLMLLGGQESVQQVLADHGSWVENVEQHMTGSGRQLVQASDDSVIIGVRQIKK